MSRSVFNKGKDVSFLKQPMFFGEDLAVQRYDTMKYPIFDKLTQQQLGYFWRPEEVSLQKDRNDYTELRPEQKDIFTRLWEIRGFKKCFYQHVFNESIGYLISSSVLPPTQRVMKKKNQEEGEDAEASSRSHIDVCSA